MKISDREKYLLGILLAVLVVVGYYQFIYTRQVSKINGLKTQQTAAKAKYDNIMNTINSLDNKEANLKILNAKIIDKSKDIYPELIQEKLILELDDLLKNASLKGNISFSNIQVQGIEAQKSTYQPLPASSLQSLADQYNNNGTSSNSKDSSKVSSGSASTTNNNKTVQQASSGQANQTAQSAQNNAAAGNTAEQMKVTLSFKGSYTNLTTFIKNIEERSKRIVLSNLSMSQSTQTGITGTLTLEFYAVPKIGDDDKEYSKWLLNNSYGKDTPFGGGQIALASTIENAAKPKEEKNDFSMVAKPINSDLPTVIIGRDNDQSRTSYLYADNAGIENVEMVVTKDKDGNYYYKYKTSKNSYPLQYDTNGIEFKPNSSDINFKIYASPRQGSTDKSGVNLKVINNTDKVVSIAINGDDGSNPRIKVTGEGKAVNVTKN
ncbi:GspMb/PilO family protein [Clostridium sp. C8-1-8]|uniref:GspMb/PilO family protein n=1 Tax=Clostridium sp. C8-1-8 TaxID=2698831 RepID=UPI00137174E5|nr:GspMb/PilO family protein [Clostridium sp. C8-1-8]